MKALIVSDNHGNPDILEELVDIYQGEVDLWLHCGDSELRANHPIWDQYQSVRGNMDFGVDLPSSRLVDFGEEKILIVHGHTHSVGSTMALLKDIAAEQGADVVFYGHTHIARVDQIDGIDLINPGSIVQPRGALREGSYAIYEKNGDERFIHFYDWNHNEIKELSTVLD